MKAHRISYVAALFALFLVTSTVSYSQGFTLFSYDYFPSKGDGATEEPGADLSFSRLNIGLDFHVPLRQGRTHLINGLRYRHVGLRAGAGSMPFGTLADLQYVRYEMALVHQLSPTWAATVIAAPGLSSDGKGGITWDALHLKAGLLISKVQSPRLTYGFGVLYRNRLGAPLLPMLQLKGTFGKRFGVDVMIPTHAHVWYGLQTARKVGLGLHARYSATPYAVHRSASTGVYDGMVHSFATAGPSINIHLKGAYNLVLDGGVTLWNTLTFEGPGPATTLQLGRSPYVRAAVEVRFKTLSLASRQVRVDPVAVADDDGAVWRLSRSIQIPVISYPGDAEPEREAILTFHDFLENAYPRVHAAMRRETVNRYSLLYTWPGRDTTLAPVLLAAHMDAVPVEPSTLASWTHPPFEGHVDEQYVWGRGTMDDRFSLISIMEALDRLLAEGFVPERTVYVAFGHDEERGGAEGAHRIAALLQTRGVHLAYVLDEGLCVTEGIVPGMAEPVALVGIAEKGAATLKLSVEEAGGHSSAPLRETAIGILSRAVAQLEAHQMPTRLDGPVAQMLAYLVPEMSYGKRLAFANLWLSEPLLERQLARHQATNTLIRTTTAPTIFKGGFKENVLPANAEAVVNFRILQGDSVQGVIEHVTRVVKDRRVRIETTGITSEPSPVSDPASPHFQTIQRTIRQVFPGVTVVPALMIARTDARHYAALTPNVYRFAPIRARAEDATRIHSVDERIAIDNLSEGIGFYHQLIRNSTAGDPVTPAHRLVAENR